MLRPQVVAIGSTVYVGGGLSKTSMLSIFAYNTSDCTWRTLPTSGVILFGMCSFQGHLITVGGGCEDGITGRVYTLDKGGEETWSETLPSMSSERFSLSVFSSTDSFIVACGGGIWEVGKDSPTPCTTVEVYSSESRAWFPARDLPRPCAAMSGTLIENTCYLLGDVDPEERASPILYADIADFPSSSDNRRDSSKSIPTLKWHHLPPPPVSNTSIVATKSYLLAIGGYDDGGTTHKVVYIYLKEQKQWYKLSRGDLPLAMESCGSTVLESGEVMVVGGEDRNGMFTESAFIGNLL